MPAAPECAYFYRDGRHCRRIPARTESFCRAHRPRQPDEEALNAEAIAYCRQLDNLPLADVLDSLSETIAAMSPIAEDARIPYAVRAAFSRSSVAITVALDLVGSQYAPQLTPDQLTELCDRMSALAK
jgi:hypothetical protein